MMTYSVPCECGSSIEAKAADAGATVVCRCGRAVQVPLLSQLRRSAGKAGYESSLIDLINRLVSEGQLPPGPCCAVSGLPCEEIHRFYVECERVWLKRRGTMASILFYVVAFFMIPVWMLIMFRRDPPELVGRQLGVYVPLRVRSEFKPKLRKMSQSQLRKLLGSVEVYQRLLEQYPEATITA